MWEICGKFFVINRKKPTQLILFESFTNEDGAFGDISTQKLSENVYRVFFPTSSGEVGCGLSLTNLYIYDFDFNRNICRQFQYPDGSFAKDLNEDGNNQLILFPEVGGGVHWPWVYFWDGKKWINESLKYWKFYKNGTIGPRGICPGETIKEILNAFNLAVQNDEPLRYWKQTEKGN
jgi:hypothetical protein